VLWYNVLKLPKLLWRLVRIPFSINNAYTFFLKHKFDLVHLNTSTLFACAIAAKRAGLKIVWHIREPLHRGYFGIRRHFIRKFIFEYSDKILPICRYDSEQLIPTDKIHVVYNFVDFTKFDRTISGKSFRQKFNIKATAKVVGMLGGVNKIKGTKEFVEAAAIIANTNGSRSGSGKEERHEILFLIIGDYPQPRGMFEKIRLLLNGSLKYYKSVLDIIKQHQLKNIVRFTGMQQNVPEVIAALDVLVFPSTIPHFARPIIEAGAMAKPVVASRLGGPEELVVDGVTGILIPPRDPKQLAEAIYKLLMNEQTAKAMGEEGCKPARQLFDAETNVRDVMTVYDEVLKVE
jgi:glycosyltransferase involved in cell wall biosynthesis